MWQYLWWRAWSQSKFWRMKWVFFTMQDEWRHTGRRIVARSELHDRWERRREEPSKGSWIHRFIPNIRVWLERKYEEINYHITLFPTGQSEYCRQYLHRFELDYSPNYPVWVVHRRMQSMQCVTCPRFAIVEKDLNEALGRSVSPTSIVAKKLRSKKTWLLLIGEEYRNA